MTKAELKLQLDNEIAKAILAGLKSYAEIGKKFGVWHGYVIAITRRNGFKRLVGKGSPCRKNRQKQGA